jgi:hypothetical protein
MESVMTILMPVALLSVAPVLFFSYSDGLISCWQPSEQAWRCSDRAWERGSSGCCVESAWGIWLSNLPPEAVEAGFDSVVFDLSGLPLEENTRSTRQAVEELSPLNPAVVVEGER